MRARLDRRTFLRYSASVGVAASVAQLAAACTTEAVGEVPAGTPSAGPFRWLEASIADMQAAMTAGETTAVQLVRDHIDRIERLDWNGPRVNSVIETNPDAESIAADLDRERAEGHVRGPLHGIPIMVKDAVATKDRMQTTAGSLALLGSIVPRDAGVVVKLREAGAIVLGKNNMSEWNAFRGWPLHGGWSARAGMGLNPYALGFSTGDSSSGSAAAVAASFAAGAIGLETYGSIVMPSSLCGIVGLKPTLGLIGRSGSIGISFSRDVLGPMARTVSDVASILSAIVGVDPHDDLTAASAQHVDRDYTRFLDADGLRGARIGIWRRNDLWKERATAKVVDAAIEVMRESGAEIVDDIELPQWLEATGEHIGVMFSEFTPRIDRYLAGLSNASVRTLADVVAFNEEHADEELRWHNQGTLESALSDGDLTGTAGYRKSLRRSADLGRRAFDLPMREHGLDAIFSPTFRRPWLINMLDADDPMNGNGAAGPSNAAGYPHITVPAGYADELPIGASFMARAWEEPKLLRYAYAFEQANPVRHAPRFLPNDVFVERT